MSGRVLVVGDVIDDVIVRPSGPIRDDTDTPSTIERLPGGSAANTACWLAADGVRATLVATVGEDDVERCGAELARHGVRPHLAAAAAGTTGAIVVLSEGERRSMLTDRGANLETGPELVTGRLLAEHAHLHITGHVFTGRDRDTGWRRLLDAAQAAGLRRSVAPGSAGLLADHGAARFTSLVAGVEVLVASEEEALLLTGASGFQEAAEALGDRHEIAAVTLGWRGALLSAGGTLHYIPAEAAVPADVTGAGDAWVAGLIAGLQAGEEPAEAGRRAARLSATAVQRIGARPA